MLRAALTGGIATGKSHCLRAFAALGAPVIDADILARDVVAPGTPGLSAVVRRFGSGVLDAAGALDRDALGRIVFDDPRARRDLEGIIHPSVYAAITAWFQEQEGRTAVAIADIPLLFETNHAHDFDKVIVAACSPAEQLNRLMARDGLSAPQARRRIAAQMPIDEKRTRGDYVIDTSGTVSETNRQVAEVWKSLSGSPDGGSDLQVGPLRPV
jgi:dephospho-CoA kinase